MEGGLSPQGHRGPGRETRGGAPAPRRVPLAEAIRAHFGITYHVDHLGRLLRALGFSPQQPQRRALERDEAAIQRWIKQDWPRAKKKPRG